MNKNKHEWKDYEEGIRFEAFMFRPYSNETLYESTKKYFSTLAFNDGTWLKFPTVKYRRKKRNGNVKVEVYSNIDHKDIRSLLKDVIDFGVFQRMIGVTRKEEILAAMLNYLCKVIGEELDFPCNDDNKAVMDRAVDHVMKVEITDEMKEKYKDDRQYCLERSYINTHDDKDIRKALYKGKHVNAKMRMMMKYDQNKSIRQNASDIGCSIDTICKYKKWLKDKPEEVRQIRHLMQLVIMQMKKTVS